VTAKKRRFVWIGIIIVVLLVVAKLVFAPSRIAVDLATIGSDTLRVTVNDEGQTRARDRFTIASPVTGRLQRIMLDEGDSVSGEQIVARVAPAPEDPRTIATGSARIAGAEARQHEVAAEVDRTRRASEQASREAERRRKLEEAGAISEEAVEQADLAATSARQEWEAAKASLRAADADVAAARAALLGANAEAGTGAAAVRSPVAGRVLRVLEKSERVVQAGTPLLEIADPDGLEVVIDVLSEDAVRVNPRDEVRLTGWGGDSVLIGWVRTIEPAAFTKVSALGVEEQRVNIIANLAAAPPSLGTGYRVQASIVVWQADSVLTVPTSAIFQRDGAWRTFVVEDGRARERELHIGHRGRDAAEVLVGLVAGDRVILYPSADIADGARVAGRE
jgi:HlyD family secretion protein